MIDTYWLFHKYLRRFPKSSVSIFTGWKLSLGFGKDLGHWVHALKESLFLACSFSSPFGLRWTLCCNVLPWHRPEGEALIDHSWVLKHRRTKTRPFSLHIDHIKITHIVREHWLAQNEIRFLCVGVWNFYILFPKLELIFDYFSAPVVKL